VSIDTARFDVLERGVEGLQAHVRQIETSRVSDLTITAHGNPPLLGISGTFLAGGKVLIPVASSVH
jgi:hypothetical protein